MFRIIVISIISILFTLVGFASGIIVKCEALEGPIPGPNVGDSVDIPMLVQPQALALIDNGNKALVADNTRLSILDLSTKQVQIAVSGLKNPMRIAIESSDTALIVQLGEPKFSGDPSGQLIRVNYVIGEKTILATGFVEPRGVTIEADNQSALVRDKNGIFRVNLLTGTTSQLVSGFGSGDIAIEPWRASAIFPVTMYQAWSSGIKRINLLTNEVTDVPYISGPPIKGDAIEVAFDGSFALVAASHGEAGIAKVDLITGETTQIFNMGISLYCSYNMGDIALSGDVSELIFTWTDAYFGQKLSRIRLSDNTFSTVTYGIVPIAMTIEENGNSVIILHNRCVSGYMSRLSMASGVVELVTGFSTSFDISILPNNNEALVSSKWWYYSYGDLLRVNLSTGESTKVCEITPDIRGVVAESDTTALVTSGDRVCRVDLATGAVSVLAQEIESPGGLALESAGQSAIVGSIYTYTSKNEVYRVDLNTGEVINIATFTSPPQYVTVDPADGSVLVAVANKGLSRIDLITGVMTDIVTGLPVSGKVIVETGGETTLLATSEGIKRVRIRPATSPPQPILSVTPDALDFGSVEVGSSKDLDFTVQNTGDGTLSGTASTGMPFSIVAGGTFNLAAGQSQTVTVRFSPTSSGIFMSNVTFTSNGGSTSPVIQGDGVEPLQLDIWYIEVNQAVQRIDPDTLTNQVPLVAGKDTVVRAYVRKLSLNQPDPANVTGALYKSPAGQNDWTPIGTLDTSFITAVKDDPFTNEVEPTPEMIENTLNFKLPGGLPEGSYDLRVEVRLGSNPTVIAEKIVGVTFHKRKTFKILYTKVNYNGDLLPGNFSDAYLLLQGVFPMPFNQNQWIADTSSLIYRAPLFQKLGCGISSLRDRASTGTALLLRLRAHMLRYNMSRPPEERVNYIVGIVTRSRLVDGVDGCSNKALRAAFVTDKAGAIRAAVGHEIGHLNGLPIPERGKEEYPGGPEGIGYPIDQGFKVQTERKHFSNYSDPLNTVTKFHHLFFNFMGLANEQNTWVDEKTYNFLFEKLSPK